VTTTPDLADVKEAVKSALADIVSAYGEDRVRVVPDGQGGAWIEIAEVELGDHYAQDTTFVICLLPFNLPGADVYPLFVRNDLTRRDGKGLGEGFGTTSVNWPGDAETRPVVQVSRRTRGNAFVLQTPRQKIDKVFDWVRSR
jgi:hypothetical protein